jgi:formylglycine-generating enzyme required for sulfatase activity
MHDFCPRRRLHDRWAWCSGYAPSASVSDFNLDKDEVTAGRFRKFVDAYTQDMIPQGAGRNPNNPDDTGWDAVN